MGKKKLNQKITELNDAVAWFQSEEFEIEQAIEKYKMALKLANEIEDDLSGIKNEIEVLTKDFTK